MSNSSPPWDTYHAMLAGCLIDQANTVCVSLQLCVGLEAGIEGATHAVAQRRRERHMPEPGGEADKGSERAEDESVAETSGEESAGGAARIRGIGEVPRPPRERITAEEGGGGDV